MTDKRMHINVLAHALIPEDGYGRYILHTIKGLAMQGVDVYPMLNMFSVAPQWVQRMAGFDTGRVTLSIMPAHCLTPVSGRHWLLTMTEDDSCPKGWVEHINQHVERLIVPCEHNADVFKTRGVKCPIHVVHGGTDPVEFPILPLAKRKDYTFLALGDRGARKGIETVWSAFFTEFKEDEPVRLVIKQRPSMTDLGLKRAFSNHKRVSFWIDDTPSLSDVFSQADCFVYPAYGDGWGMPPREASMMGLPVIATRWSGLEVGIDNWAIPIEKFEMQRSTLPHMEGNWAVPDLSEVRKHMRWCYEHQDEAKEQALNNAKWLRANQTWEHSTKTLKALLEEYA